MKKENSKMGAEKKTIEKLKELIRQERKQNRINIIVLWIIVMLDLISFILKGIGK